MGAVGDVISGALGGAASLVTAFKTSDAEWDYKKCKEVAEIQADSIEKTLQYLEKKDSKEFGLQMFQTAMGSVQASMMGSIGGSLLTPLCGIL